MSARFAVYFAPSPNDPLHALGSRWIGRDAESGEQFAPLDVPGLSGESFGRLIRSAATYGFHATLKAPMRLRDGTTEAQLVRALEAFAAARAAVLGPNLRSFTDGRFAYLGFDSRCADVDALAADCVRSFDSFRAEPDGEELRRRRAGDLTASQEANLVRWGYPYVLDDFVFHLTLAELPEDARVRSAVRAAIPAHFAPVLGTPLRIDQIALFVQPAPGAAFRLRRRFPLAGGQDLRVRA